MNDPHGRAYPGVFMPALDGNGRRIRVTTAEES